MAEPKPPTPPKAPTTKAARNRKMLLIAVGVIVAIGVGLYLRKHMSSGTTGATSTGASDTGAGGNAGAGSGPDLTPVEDLAQSLNGLTTVLGAGGGFSGFDASAAADTAPTNQFTASSVPQTAATQQAAPAAARVSAPVATPGKSVGAGAGGGFTITPPTPTVSSSQNGSYNAPTFGVPSGITSAAIDHASPTHPAVTKTIKAETPPPSGYSQKSKANLH